MDVDSCIGRSQAPFRSWAVKAGEVCALLDITFIREGDTLTHWRETTDRQTERPRQKE